MEKYTESKKRLQKLESKNPIMFRMALSHMIDVGIRHLDEETVKEFCEAIMKEDDTNSFMTNEFQCELIRTSAAIAKINHIHTLIYITEEIYYDKGEEEIE